MTTPVAEETTLETAPTAASQEQKAEQKASAAPQKPRVASKKGKSSKKTTPAKKAAKAPKSAKTAKTPKGEKKPGAARKGSKTATVLALIQRAKGATLATQSADLSFTVQPDGMQFLASPAGYVELGC